MHASLEAPTLFDQVGVPSNLFHLCLEFLDLCRLDPMQRCFLPRTSDRYASAIHSDPSLKQDKAH